MAYIKKADRREPIEHFHCLVCGAPIDPIRVISKRVLTCSNEHARLLKLERRRLRNLNTSRCRLCNRPSSPEERALFTAWRRDQAKQKGIRPGPKKAQPPAAGASPLEKDLGTTTVH